MRFPAPSRPSSFWLAAVALGLVAGAAQAQDTPKSGGTLVVGLQVQSQCLDPQQHQHGFGSREGRQIVDSLTDQGLEDASKIVPWLAKSWEINADATRYVFHLRDDVTFSDGAKLNANVVKDNFEALAKIPGAAGAEYLSGVASIEVLDPATVAIAFREPNLAFLAATATSELGLVSPATAKKAPDARCYEGVIGSGPFVIESAVFNEQVVLAKRKDYNWASSLKKHQGEAYLDKVVAKVIPEASVRTGALTSGQVDLIAFASYQDAAKLKEAGFSLVNAPYVGTAASLFVNVSRPVVSDVEVRRALRQGINTQDVVELVQNGYVDAATGLLTPKTPGFLDQTRQLPYDLDAAKARLDKAGWKEGADGIRVKDGQRLKITGAFFSNALNRQLFEVLQQQLRDLGVDFIVKPIPSSAEYLQGQIRGDYDVYRWHWSLADPDVLRKDYSSAGINRLRLPPENDIDALLVKQAGTTDPVERRKLTDEVQTIILDRGYGIPLFNPDNLWAANGKVKGLAFGPSGTGGPHVIFFDTWLAQ
ncbi:ABC transporter substrate-binding protein [Ancylobacter sp. Lp-2]|uniref:ABC transporter substrate-binding protein n=1 Tax=Ancylobacter sp. Lp-2 TaxID=2881339 RepID=UPI001E5D9B87|nr:ABC transporter substrate-binding protein [Ancylobacter sp. Lp-2]MCB4770449.1 ABC transporter substrate-binding protein [Ancylobacter sp. Lp-2]